MKKLILLFIFIPSVVQAEYFSDFSRQDWILQGVLTGLFYIDHRQTIRFLNGGSTELNPSLGKSPSNQKARNMASLGAASHASVSYYFPDKYRTWWQIGFILIESAVVYHNRKIYKKRKYKQGPIVVFWVRF